MATAITPGEEEKGRKGRRSRARARAEALADSAVTIPVAETVPVAAAVAQPSESPLAAAVRARRERKQAAVAAGAALAPRVARATAAELDREPEAAEPEPFHDLLGQAIGLRLDGLEGRSRMRASRLSGGEQQKVAVARALANRPGLVLADEPTGSLDSVAGERVLNLLRDLNRRGATVVLVTHDPEVARYAQRAVRMVDGRAFELGSRMRNVRMQDPLLPAARLHWRDTLRLGLLSAGRRPLRTFLTTTGVAIGIAAMSLIVALSGGLDFALAAPAFAHAKTDVIAVRPASDSTSAAFDAQSLHTVASLPHVQSAWGQVPVNGSFAAPSGTTGGANDPLIALAPRAQWDGSVRLIAGSMPTSDTA